MAAETARARSWSPRCGSSSGPDAVGTPLVGRDGLPPSPGRAVSSGHGAAFLAMQIDRLMVMTLWDNGALGQYVVAFSMASAGLSVVGARLCTGCCFPHLARVVDAGTQASCSPAVCAARHVASLHALAEPLRTVHAAADAGRLPGHPSRRVVVGTSRVLVLASAAIAVARSSFKACRGLGDRPAGHHRWPPSSIAVFLARERRGRIGAASLGLAGVAGRAGDQQHRRLRIPGRTPLPSLRYQAGPRELWGLNAASRDRAVWNARPPDGGGSAGRPRGRTCRSS